MATLGKIYKVSTWS